LKDQVLFVDLDGTITDPSVNNTFDFLKSYLYGNYGILGIIRYHLSGLISKLLYKLVKDEALSRRLYLVLCTFGLKKSELRKYATKYWLKLVKNHMNDDVLILIGRLRDQGYSPILLTSCIEIPACQIAKFLKFEECIATRFRYLGDLIVGIAEDTYAYLKFQVVRGKYGSRIFRHAIYIVDLESAKMEYPHKFFNGIYIISTGSKLK
jgi:phosphoserine phosphatase